MGEYIGAFIFVGLICIVVGSMLALASLIGPRNPKLGKSDPYECGALPVGGARDRFSVKFYLVALLFILFEIETVFLIPWATAFRGLGSAAVIEAIVFVSVLGLGLFYIIKRGALKWD